MFKPLTITRRIFQSLAGNIEPRFSILPCSKIGGNGCGIASAKSIQQTAMPACVQHAAIIMLAVDFYQSRPDFPQKCCRAGLVIDKCLATAIGLNRPAND